MCARLALVLALSAPALSGEGPANAGRYRTHEDAAVFQAQPRPRKIFISVDMEGITGVVQPAQLGPDGFEYQRAREWMTGEVRSEERRVGKEGRSGWSP